MKKISAAFIATSLLLFALSVTAQVPVEKIQKLLDKASGQKYVNLMGNDEKITKQVITANSYTISYTGLGKYGSKWVQENTNIPWSDGFNHYSSEDNSNSKLTLFVFKFKTDMDFYMHVEGKEGSPKSKTGSLEFYVLTKDAAEMEALIKGN